MTVNKKQEAAGGQRQRFSNAYADGKEDGVAAHPAIKAGKAIRGLGDKPGPETELYPLPGHSQE